MNELPLTTMQEIASKKFDINNISHDFIASYIFHSLSFESNFYTFEEVKRIINNNLEGIDEKKVLHVTNHKNALFFVVNLIKTKQKLNENKLKDLHEILMSEVNIGGLYRNVDISIRGSNHTPPAHLKVYNRMKAYFANLEEYNEDVFEKIAYSHLQLDKIHPFLDGNGRLARLVLTYHLLDNGLMPIVIPHTDKSHYFECTEEFKVNKNIAPFMNYIIELEKKALI